MLKLFPSSLGHDHARIFYLKLLGDLYRFKCEVDIHDEESIRICEQNYQEGLRLGLESLDA